MSQTDREQSWRERAEEAEADIARYEVERLRDRSEIEQLRAEVERQGDSERAAFIRGLRFGIDAVLGMVATAYGIDGAERLRPEASAFGEMVANNDPGSSS